METTTAKKKAVPCSREKKVGKLGLHLYGGCFRMDKAGPMLPNVRFATQRVARFTQSHVVWV